MANGARQVQQQKQKQTTTTSAVQVMLSKAIEMPLGDYEQHVQNELESNDALEQAPDENSFDYDDPGEVFDYGINDEFGVRNSHTSEDEYGDFLTMDEVPEDVRRRFNNDIQLRHGGTRQYDGDTELQISDNGATTFDELKEQIRELHLTEKEQQIMIYLIGSLDSRGYLSKDNETLIDELNFQEYLDVEPEELERVIAQLQTCEPLGIGARDLQDCLLIQMRVDSAEKARLSLSKRLAFKIVRDMWEDFIHARWNTIQNALDVNDEAIKEIQNTIRHLDPFPGKDLNESLQATAPTIIPDFYVYVDEDYNEPVVIQERGNIPNICVNSGYSYTVDEYNKAQERAKKEGTEFKPNKSTRDAYEFAAHKVEDAKAFLESMRRRKHTLQAVMEGIVKKQKNYFINQDDETLLQPMILQDVADFAKVDISTVSRAVNSKYVKTEYGVYPLKIFFGKGFTNADGDEVSQREAMSRVDEIIKNEDPHHPLSDQKIADILKENGMTLARRTVAKYRDRLGYATASQRRQ